ncbi:hypothetical protein [Domibacillus robiginosus]|uniref:hypothetical protein n=1 Tax=Domibacillus robiginosus TaxID=1071054 RepID=UPI00067D5107|nr:hypothetical protein [Domibacillus robiginosus]
MQERTGVIHDPAKSKNVKQYVKMVVGQHRPEKLSEGSLSYLQADARKAQQKEAGCRRCRI